MFGFLDNCIWMGSGKFSLLLREYSWLAVNVLWLHFIAYSEHPGL